jgi:membrane-associated phospholipid phosphatase
MPSSHTVYAVVLASFLVAMYPRLRGLWITLAALVAFCRLLFDAHWASDVVVGAGLGAAVTWTILSRFLGVRFLDNLWRWLVDSRAKPAEPSLRRVFKAPPRGTAAE